MASLLKLTRKPAAQDASRNKYVTEEIVLSEQEVTDFLESTQVYDEGDTWLRLSVVSESPLTKTIRAKKEQGSKIKFTADGLDFHIRKVETIEKMVGIMDSSKQEITVFLVMKD